MTSYAGKGVGKPSHRLLEGWHDCQGRCGQVYQNHKGLDPLILILDINTIKTLRYMQD